MVHEISVSECATAEAENGLNIGPTIVPPGHAHKNDERRPNTKQTLVKHVCAPVCLTRPGNELAEHGQHKKANMLGPESRRPALSENSSTTCTIHIDRIAG